MLPHQSNQKIIKEIFHTEMNILSSFTHSHYRQNQCDFLSSVEHKMRCLVECPNCSFPYNNTKFNIYNTAVNIRAFCVPQEKENHISLMGICR